MRLAVPVLLTLLSACGSAPPSGGVSERQLDALDGFQALARDAGWTVQDGAFTFAELAFCCEPFVHCGGADPAAALGVYSVPKSPNQEAMDPDLYFMWGDEPPGDTTRDFRLQPDEALVWIGIAPPRADYLAFRTLLSTRDDGSGNRERVTGALGPPTNHQVLVAERGGDERALWGEPLIVVTSADFAVERQVIDWLVRAGFSEEHVHIDRIAANEARLGLEREADTLTTQVHVLGLDPGTLARWKSAGHQVLRLTPSEAPPAEPIGTPVLPPRGTGTDESDLLGGLNELTVAVAANWQATHASLARPMFWDWHQTFGCFAGLDCQGDTHDRLRSETPDLRLDNGGFAVLMGVNHVKTGKATAMTVAAHRSISGAGVAWLDHTDLEGTARAWLGDSHPRADELYAVIAARDCDTFLAPCIEVPSLCPGPALDEDLYLSVSTYLEPATGAAPATEELLLDRTLKFTPVVP